MIGQGTNEKRDEQGINNGAKGLGPSAVFWRDMGVVNLPSGKPTLALTGGAAKRLAEITPPGMKPLIDLSLTDERPIAQAIVIITAVPDTDGELSKADV